MLSVFGIGKNNIRTLVNFHTNLSGVRTIFAQNNIDVQANLSMFRLMTSQFANVMFSSDLVIN